MEVFLQNSKTLLVSTSGIFLSFLSRGQGPVEFGKIAIKPSKLGKLDSVKKQTNWIP